MEEPGKSFAPSREKYWKDLSIEEKSERTREVVNGLRGVSPGNK